MFSKLLLASAALSSTEALKISLRGGREDCKWTIERRNSPHETQDFSKYHNGGSQYKDPDFPADESSLFWRSHLKSSSMANSYIKQVNGWARPTEMVDGTPNLFGAKGVLPTGTNQGILGDCWFLASTAALAENANRIEQIFTNSEYDSAGIFQVTFYHMTKPVKITVDDRLPINEGTDKGYTNFGIKRPVDTKESKNHAWWQPILEKAYAKFYTNYSQLNGGQPGVAFRDLTNMPVETYDFTKQSDDEFFKIVSEADKKGWAMAASCKHKFNGLITGHAYSLLGTVVLSGGPKLVHVRNPWGREEYKGPFRDDDPQWTDQWKKEAGMVAANDGAFFIPLSEYKKSFTTYSIVMYQKWQTQHLEVDQPGFIFKLSFTSPVSQEVILTLDYQNDRINPAGCKSERDKLFFNMYIDGGKPLAVSTQTGYWFVRTKAEAGKTHSLEVYNWRDHKATSNFVLSSYAEQGEVKIDLVSVKKDK